MVGRGSRLNAGCSTIRERLTRSTDSRLHSSGNDRSLAQRSNRTVKCSLCGTPGCPGEFIATDLSPITDVDHDRKVAPALCVKPGVNWRSRPCRHYRHGGRGPPWSTSYQEADPAVGASARPGGADPRTMSLDPRRAALSGWSPRIPDWTARERRGLLPGRSPNARRLYWVGERRAPWPREPRGRRLRAPSERADSSAAARPPKPGRQGKRPADDARSDGAGWAYGSVSPRRYSRGRRSLQSVADSYA